MRGTIYQIMASCAVACGVVSTAAVAADFSGSYKGTSLSVVIAPDVGGYTGEIQKGQQHFPIKAREENGRLVGTFSTPDASYEFVASADGDDLTLVSGGVRYAMYKSAGGGGWDGYTVITTTDFGKALTAEKPAATDVKSAFQSTFPDLARSFGERPAVQGVFEDSRDHKSAGASFTAHLNGQAIKGVVSCKIGDKGATMAVVYCRADAPNSEWNKLIAAPAASGAATQAAEIKLQEYHFPDDTGTVGLAQGWTTHSQSLMTGVEINGPADQKMILALGASVVTLDNPMFQIHRQMEMQARQFGGPPPPPLPIQALVAAYTDPATALKELMPQISRLSQSTGGPAIAIDKIVSVKETPPMLPNAKAAIITYDVTRTAQGAAKHYRAGNRFEMTPIGQGAWMLYASEVCAPIATYDRDLPVMIAMAASLRENPRVIAEKSRINIEQANERFAAQQRANKELTDAFDEQRRSWRRNELIRDRSFADADEVINGYRTVEDTTTGNRRSVDLGNVHDIVDRMNQYDPGRYKEIPLRDEMYPLPGH